MWAARRAAHVENEIDVREGRIQAGEDIPHRQAENVVFQSLKTEAQVESALKQRWPSTLESPSVSWCERRQRWPPSRRTIRFPPCPAMAYSLFLLTRRPQPMPSLPFQEKQTKTGLGTRKMYRCIPIVWAHRSSKFRQRKTGRARYEHCGQTRRDQLRNSSRLRPPKRKSIRFTNLRLPGLLPWSRG